LQKKKVALRIIEDAGFKNSYWSFNAEKKTEEAVSHFERQFPDIKFEIQKIDRTWDSEDYFISSSDLVSAIKTLTKDATEREVPVRIAQQLNFDEEEIREREINWKREDSTGSMDYLLGYFDSMIFKENVKKLMGKLKEEVKNESKEKVIGFTAKIFPLLRDWEKTTSENRYSGLATESYALVGIIPDPVQTTIHELGHLFGAKHSILGHYVMSTKRKRISYEFCKANKRIISQHLANNY